MASVKTKEFTDGSITAKALTALTSQHRMAVAATAALAATSVVFAVLGGGGALSFGSLMAAYGPGAAIVGSSAAASSYGMSATIAAVAAASAAAGSTWLRRRSGAAESGEHISKLQDGTNDPLMSWYDSNTIDSARSTDAPQSTARTDTIEDFHDDEQETEYVDMAPLKRRDPFRGRRHVLLKAARERTASWVALLIRGLPVTIDGERCEISLQRPRWQKLMVRKEVFPLITLGLRLDGDLLHLVLPSEEENESKDRIITLELDEKGWALELALALKTIRAEADSGGGIMAWGDRPADDLRRPPPAE